MRILAIGDVCGSIGCRYLQSVLPKIKREKNIDAVIVNGENSADGNGITPESAAMLFNCGADIITGGNHTLRRKEVYDYLDENEFVLRPHNLPNASFGRGYGVVDFGFTRFAVINVSGKIYFEDKTIENPFTVADELIERAKADGIKIILVDFHAEATSEKRALGLYLDGKASAVFGTHTHVQTADEQILSGGTGYITDLGMTGPADGILGVDKECVLYRFLTKMPKRYTVAQGEIKAEGAVFEIDAFSKKALSVKRIKF